MSGFSFDAFIFDLDGVVTQTAQVHSNAWKLVFDQYLKERATSCGEPFREFTHQEDFLTYVDGRPRYEGIAAFFKSRAINLPFGDPSDEPPLQTICAIGNQKNIALQRLLKERGVKAYPSTVRLIKELKAAGIRVAVASSSRNCDVVLSAAGLSDLFETRVDGIVAETLGLNGKPEPDIFLKACANLNVSAARSVVVEDAVSGVEAGRKGQFGLTIGVARDDNLDELKSAGADIVVKDLQDITLRDVEEWFTEGVELDKWSLAYNWYNPAKESMRETLCTVGNGYFAARGSAEGTKTNGINYPGTYIAGVYNRVSSKIGEQILYNEDLVNVPNWTYINFAIGDEQWSDYNQESFGEYEQRLDFRSGLLTRRRLVSDNKGRKTLIQSQRFASMDDPHLGIIRYQITPVNHAGKISVISSLDGLIENLGVERYKQLNSKQLDCVKQGAKYNSSHILMRTNQSNIEIAQAAKLNFFKDGEEITPILRHEILNGSVDTMLTVELGVNETLTIDKLVAIYTSRDYQVTDALSSALSSTRRPLRYADLFAASAARWAALWEDADVIIEGDRLSQKLIRMHIYHLLVTASSHNQYIDAGICARGLHGEAYRGHIFWDELFILPFYTLHFPEITKSALLYRYRRLAAARSYARDYGYKGAMFPWQSGSDGAEETQIMHLNPLTGEWGEDFSASQRHVSLAIAANIIHYYHFTEDDAFFSDFGMEMLLEICRFISSLAEFNKDTRRYEIKNVMGPDEYHEEHPLSPRGGVKDNAYTNIMAAWVC